WTFKSFKKKNGKARKKTRPMKKQVNKTSSSSNLDSSPEEDQRHYIPLVILISTWRSDSERTFLPIYGKALMERCCKEEAESTKAPAGMKPGAMAAPSVDPVTRQISGRAAPAPHFLCYICKEYVEDLAKIPKSFLQEANVTLIVIGQSSYHHIEPFCKLTGYSHEIYVDPEREIYKRLGMKRGEEIASSGQSPHIKSNILSGSIRSLWRAVTGPLFDFQGDPAQQGGTLILGPGNNIHFIHRDRNRLDHKPINSVLQLVGVQHVDFTSRPSVIHV
ncbi:hypothetical protein E2I00_000045, partial [Balaenoptera physalus]